MGYASRSIEAERQKGANSSFLAFWLPMAWTMPTHTKETRSAFLSPLIPVLISSGNSLLDTLRNNV